MRNTHPLSELSVGHILPNNWTVMAYAVSDRHGMVMCNNGNPIEDGIKYAVWSVSNDDLRSTAGGDYTSNLKAAWTLFQSRVSGMYMLS